MFSYFNQRFLKLPFVIALFLLSLAMSIVVLVTKQNNPAFYENMRHLVERSNISRLVIDIFLAPLLFAGALHTPWLSLRKQLKAITTFAVGGVILSTLLVAALFYYGAQIFGVNLEFIYCLIFGALISPTDPIAVLGIIKEAKVPKKIESIIIGESLFNDGVGVVVFLALLEMLDSGKGFDPGRFGILFLQEGLGGIAGGLILGFLLNRMIRKIDHYETEILLTLTFVMLGYIACNALHVSGALAMVVMGLLTGNYRKRHTFSEVSEEYLNKFWELVDVMLNAILFIIIAFAIVLVDFSSSSLYLGLLSIVILQVSRALVIYLPISFSGKTFNLSTKDAGLITWSGLRGGLSLALALSLPESPQKHIILVATYLCVVFSILVQGLTIGGMAKRYNRRRLLNNNNKKI